jgi:hypothetical protein
MEKNKSICNSWYWLNGIKYCPWRKATGCGITGDVKCGLYEPEQELEPAKGTFGLFGWECPRCHKIHSPFISSCDCVPPIINATT